MAARDGYSPEGAPFFQPAMNQWGQAVWRAHPAGNEGGSVRLREPAKGGKK